MTGVAAPLLAGFSLTLIGVIAQDPTNIRWPGATLLALVIAISLFVACIQFGFHARARLYSAADIEDWRPDFFEKHKDILADQQRLHQEQWKAWADRARVTYNLAICVLTFGVAMIVAPRDGYREAALRWGASALLLAAGVGEIAWIATDHPRVYAWIPNFFRRHLRSQQPPKPLDRDAEADTSAGTTHRNGLGDA